MYSYISPLSFSKNLRGELRREANQITRATCKYLNALVDRKKKIKKTSDNLERGHS